MIGIRAADCKPTAAAAGAVAAVCWPLCAAASPLSGVLAGDDPGGPVNQPNAIAAFSSSVITKQLLPSSRNSSHIKSIAVDSQGAHCRRAAT
jgi:hypothetical protein